MRFSPISLLDCWMKLNKMWQDTYIFECELIDIFALVLHFYHIFNACLKLFHNQIQPKFWSKISRTVTHKVINFHLFFQKISSSKVGKKDLAWSTSLSLAICLLAYVMSQSNSYKDTTASKCSSSASAAPVYWQRPRSLCEKSRR